MAAAREAAGRDSRQQALSQSLARGQGDGLGPTLLLPLGKGLQEPARSWEAPDNPQPGWPEGSQLPRHSLSTDHLASPPKQV